MVKAMKLDCSILFCCFFLLSGCSFFGPLKKCLCNIGEDCGCGKGTNKGMTVEQLSNLADMHEEKLKNYFSIGITDEEVKYGGEDGHTSTDQNDVYGSERRCSYGAGEEYEGREDVSTLIRRTRAISTQLKARGMYGRANRFDSYIDVLMYGNRTLEESIRDVEDLVKTGQIGQDSLSNVGMVSRNTARRTRCNCGI